MGSVLNPPRSSPVRSRLPAALGAVGLAAVVVALVFVAQRLTPSPVFVDRITVVNPTVYNLEIEAIGVDRSLPVSLGPIGREQTKTFEDVIDQGREWIFRFSSAWADGGEVRIPRAQLQHDGWRLTVPDDVARRLQKVGMSPSSHG